MQLMSHQAQSKCQFSKCFVAVCSLSEGRSFGVHMQGCALVRAIMKLSWSSHAVVQPDFGRQVCSFALMVR